MLLHAKTLTPRFPRADRECLRIRTTQPLQFIDITDEVSEAVAASGVREGFVNVQSRHTTASVIVNEHEPLLLQDMERTLEQLAPRTASYRHDDMSVRTVNVEPGEPPNGHAHCKSLFLRASETLNVVEGRLDLGRWQRLFLLELDGPRDREVSIRVLGI